MFVCDNEAVPNLVAFSTDGTPEWRAPLCDRITPPPPNSKPYRTGGGVPPLNPPFETEMPFIFNAFDTCRPAC